MKLLKPIARLLVKKDNYKHLSGGRWITVTKEGPLHGRHLYISDNGTILAGKVPSEFHGKNLAEINMPHANHPLHEKAKGMTTDELKEHHDLAEEGSKAKAVLAHHLKLKEAMQNAPHMHMSTAHHFMQQKSADELEGVAEDHKLSAKYYAKKGDEKAAEYHKKMADVAEHHLKQKSAGIDPREIPDEAPHTSKAPIHNTMSAMSPTELKATIAEAKQNLKDGNGSAAYNKKKIAVATYYLNGGKKPDFDGSEKGKKGQTPPPEAVAEETPKQEEAPAVEAPKEETPAPKPKAKSQADFTPADESEDKTSDANAKSHAKKVVDAAHSQSGEYNYEEHPLMSMKDHDAYHQAIADIMNGKDFDKKLKQKMMEEHGYQKKSTEEDETDLADAMLQEHIDKLGQQGYKKQKAEEATPEAPASSGEEIPHADKPHLHDFYSKMSPKALETRKDQLEKSLAETKSDYKKKQIQAKIDVINHYLKNSTAQEEAPKAEEAPKEDPKSKYSGPHVDTHMGFHQSYHDMDISDLKDAEKKALIDVATPTGVEPVDKASKAKVDVIQHYLTQKGGLPAPHPDKAHYHKELADLPAGDLKNKLKMMYEDLANGHVGALPSVIQKKIDVAHHYLDNQHGGIPHPEMDAHHVAYKGYSLDKLHEVQDNAINAYGEMEDPDKKEIIKKQAAILQHYIDLKGGTVKPLETAGEDVPHSDYFNSVFLDNVKNSPLKDLETLQTMAINTMSDSAKTPGQKEIAKKKLDVVQHWIKQKAGSNADAWLKQAPDIHETAHKAMDDFHNQAHQISTEAEHVGTNVADHGIDPKNPDHVHTWNTKIDHSSHGYTASQMKSQAQSMMKALEYGDPHTGETGGSAISAKRKVQNNLGNALKHSDNFLKFAEAVRKYGGYDESVSEKEINYSSPESRETHAKAAVRTIVSKWAGTSADSDPLAIAIQLGAQEEFGLKNSYTGYDSHAINQAHERFLNHPEIKAGLKAFVREQYNQTQSYFKKNGITHVPIFRGMRFPDEGPLAHLPLKSDSKAHFGLQPLSSFSANVHKAYQFANGDVNAGGSGNNKVLIGAMIPVERIMGSVQTGYGCMSEHEYVVLGQADQPDAFAAFRWHGSNKGDFHYNDMFKLLEKHGAGGDAVMPKAKKPKKPGSTYHIQDQHGNFVEAEGAKTVPKTHPINNHGLNLFTSKSPQGYKVYHKETGKPIANTAQSSAPKAMDYAHGYIEWKGADNVKSDLDQHSKVPDHLLKKSLRKAEFEDLGPVIQADEHLHNADWTKQSWDVDLPEHGSNEFKRKFPSHEKLPVHHHAVARKQMKKSDEERVPQSSRFAYKTHTRDPIYIPVNRLKTPYQTDRATNEDKVAENVQKIKDGVAMSPIVVGYDHDVHDGHHRLEAAKRCGHTHVPCIVGGRNERRTEAAKKRYRELWKHAEGVGGMIVRSGRLLVKKSETAPDERWVTIRGNHVKINGKGEIVEGPAHLKGLKLKPKTQVKPGESKGDGKARKQESWESKKKTPYDTKEIVEAREKQKHLVRTVDKPDYDSPERQNLRKHITDTLLSDKGAEQAKKGPHGKVLNNRRIDLVMGPPAAGKSTVLADPLAREHGSLIIDSDMAKEMLPEFDNGNGAGVVHEESARIVEGHEGVLHQALRKGSNVVLPLVGKNAEKILKMRDDLTAMGYEIHLHLNEVPKEEATKRAVARFYSQGRFVDPDYVHNDVGNKPSEAYEQLKQAGGFHSYEKVSNNVKKGEKPIVIEKLEGDAGSRRGSNGSSSSDTSNGTQRARRKEAVRKSFIDRLGRLLVKRS